MINIKVKLNKEEIKKKLGLKDGKTPTKAEISALIKPLIPEPVPGKPGLPGKNGSPDKGEEIIEKVNKDKGQKKIRKEKVEGIKELEDEMRTIRADVQQGSRAIFGFAGEVVRLYDISSLLDGVTKTFSLPQNSRVVLVSLFSTGPLRPTVDYTTTATSITFTSQIKAATKLATGQTALIQYVQP